MYLCTIIKKEVYYDYNRPTTGPVLRNDAITLKKHMNCLNDNDIDLYRLLSQKLYEISKNINPQKDYNEIKNLLFSEDKNK